MIIDLETAEKPPLEGNFDVCISGAGVAGIVLAVRLADGGRRVLLLEGGGLEYSEESQNLYIGRNIGREYFELDVTRLRFLGGTSNHWGGMCRPLDASDFQDRSAFSGARWPIDRSDLDPHLKRALDILEIDGIPADRILPGSEEKLKEIEFRSSVVRFKDKYLDYLQSSKLVTVLTHANLIDVHLDPERAEVSAFLFRSFGNDRPEVATARSFVLAMGGIENARVLLNANNDRPKGLGNEHDLVGRYFMDHPHFDVGYYVFQGSDDIGENRRIWAPTSGLMQTEGIANCGMRLVPAKGAKDEILSAAKSSIRSIVCQSEMATALVRKFRRSFSCRKKSRGKLDGLPFDNAGHIQVASEPVPNRESRVLLTEDTDQFGLRRVALDWRLSMQDKETIRSLGLIAGLYFARQDLGRFKLHDWVLSETADFPGFGDGHEIAGHHHMGTTRMGANAVDGVVDSECRVFGVNNLYVAGSSVFRTAGHANPTMTIVQLALRLSDTLLAKR